MQIDQKIQTKLHVGETNEYHLRKNTKYPDPDEISVFLKLFKRLINLKDIKNDAASVQ